MSVRYVISICRHLRSNRQNYISRGIRRRHTCVVMGAGISVKDGMIVKIGVIVVQIGVVVARGAVCIIKN